MTSFGPRPPSSDADEATPFPARETPAVGAGAPSPLERRGWAHTFAALRGRNFRLYWLGQMISLVGTAMQTVGQAWLVLQLTHDPVQLGVVGALQYLPVLLFSLFGGVFADRWPKRRVLLVTQSLAMAQALALWGLVASGAVQLWHIYVLAALLGITASLDEPTRSAFVVELVGRADLPNAIALSASLMKIWRASSAPRSAASSSPSAA